jgi:hypothetical protein
MFFADKLGPLPKEVLKPTPFTERAAELAKAGKAPAQQSAAPQAQQQQARPAAQPAPQPRAQAPQPAPEPDKKKKKGWF